jgi:hypothetical protein
MGLRTWALEPVLTRLTLLENRIMATLQQHAADLQTMKTQLTKAKAEIVQKVADLEAAIANAGNTTVEIDEAMAALKGDVQALDDLNPDAVPTP